MLYSICLNYCELTPGTALVEETRCEMGWIKLLNYCCRFTDTQRNRSSTLKHKHQSLSRKHRYNMIRYYTGMLGCAIHSCKTLLYIFFIKIFPYQRLITGDTYGIVWCYFVARMLCFFIIYSCCGGGTAALPRQECKINNDSNVRKYNTGNNKDR